MSAWHVIKSSGRDTRADFYLRRAGLRTYRPLEHRYFIDRRTQAQKFREKSLMPGYIFVRLDNIADIARIRNAIGVSYILGNWEGERFVPAEIPGEWVENLEKAGPLIVGKKVAYRKGDKIRLIINKISDMILECEGVDGRGRVMVGVEMLGKRQIVRVDPERVELAG
ncbi:MAG: transcription termination/antitermination NusG family protein [bacterium]